MIPETLFFIKIFMPCQLLYKTFPIILLRKARQGDIDELEKLLRLDSSVISDKQISKIYHNSRNKRITHERLNKAITGKPKEKIDRRKVKMSLAGLISVYSEKLGDRLNENAIRECFDQVARIKDIADIDADIPDAPGTFAKAIQRERESWKNFYR